MTITRRDFVTRVAARGGSAYAAMLALDLLGPARAQAFALDGHGRGTKIAILGAGVAGLCAAYELGKRGYDCTILEARARPGGRVWTIRNGTTETEIGGHAQVAQFSEGHYLNGGPARVPQHHVTIDYYRAFGIPIECFTNVNNNAFYHSTKASPARVRQREFRYGMRGYVDELLAKAVAHDAVDLPVTADDKEKMLAYLRADGSLRKDFQRKSPTGDGRLGYREYPGAGEQPGIERDPLGLSALIESGFGASVAFDAELDQQPQMFQPVGGIDALPHAFAARLPGKIVYGAEVAAIRKRPEGVRVTYRDTRGTAHALDADYCICTIPLAVLRDIPADWSPEMKRAIDRTTYAATTKVGLEFKRRFWEEDDRILGGISWTDQPITQIWYPSYGYLGKRGIITGTYNFSRQAVASGRRSVQERIHDALAQGARIHPQYGAEFSNAFAVAWQNIKYNRGGWANYTLEERKTVYPILTKPDGRISLAGEHISYIPGWQAGALESARLVISRINADVQAQRGVA